MRLSAIDVVPFRPDPARPCPARSAPACPKSSPRPYVYGFGVNPHNPSRDQTSTEPIAMFEIMRELDIRFVNVTLAQPLL